MNTYWLIGQDQTLAKIRALNRKQQKNPLKNRSCASSIQDLEFFKSNPKLSSRRGSCRKSGSYLDGLSPSNFRKYDHEMSRPTHSLPLTTSALASAINGQLASVAKRESGFIFI